MLLATQTVEMEKTMVNINLMQTIRVYASYTLEARPEFRQKAKGVILFCEAEQKLTFR